MRRWLIVSNQRKVLLNTCFKTKESAQKHLDLASLLGAMFKEYRAGWNQARVVEYELKRVKK